MSSRPVYRVSSGQLGFHEVTLFPLLPKGKKINRCKILKSNPMIHKKNFRHYPAGFAGCAGVA